jgi:hypothetical protein
MITAPNGGKVPMIADGVECHGSGSWGISGRESVAWARGKCAPTAGPGRTGGAVHSGSGSWGISGGGAATGAA